MCTFNALAFSLLGVLMGFLPALLPWAFPPPAIGGAGTSELWLGFMGLVQVTLGIFHVVRNEVMPLIVRVLSWRIRFPRLAEHPQPGIILRPTTVAYLTGRNSRETRLAA